MLDKMRKKMKKKSGYIENVKAESILYCMHIGWNWIKQRPHYVAEGLSSRFNITVISDYNYRLKGKYNQSDTNIDIINFYKIPKIDNSNNLYIINLYLRKVFYSKYIRKTKAKYLYLMSPNMIHYIPKRYKGSIIYDCMDDMLEFTNDEKKKAQLSESEKKLINRSEVIIASSIHLKDILIQRYGTELDSKIRVIRNAFNGEILTEKKDTKCSETGNFTLCYFGTVAEWFNFDFILKSLDEIPQLNYLIVGPLQAGTVVPQMERLNYIGPVDHDQLRQVTEMADAFMMPFVVNDLILSVDPVKLYEYINFNKNILCVKYPEIDRFENFVYFYNDYESFKAQIINIMVSQQVKYSQAQRIEFLKDNTWEKRVEQIEEAIKSICHNNDAS